MPDLALCLVLRLSGTARGVQSFIGGQMSKSFNREAMPSNSYGRQPAVGKLGTGSREVATAVPSREASICRRFAALGRIGLPFRG